MCRYGHLQPRGLRVRGRPDRPQRPRRAEGRSFVAQSESEVLEAARQRLAPELGLDEFIQTALDDRRQRAAWTQTLRATAHPVEVPGFVPLVP